MLKLAFVCLLLVTPSFAHAAEYQWSVVLNSPTTQPDRPAPRAFLWIPPDCKQVRAVIVGQHNMLEEDILEHPEFRRAMSELGVAVIWITPAMDGRFDAPEAAYPRFEQMMKSLADESGYPELEFAPIAPIGHSACASYPWNLAAWAPQRTLCVLSIHGDAPATPLAGYGRANPNWGDRSLDGVPGLMVMGEYEWIDARLAPAVVYRSIHPGAPIAMLAEPGEGHFFACDDLVHYLAMFIRKSVEQRLAADNREMTPVDPAKGWLVQRWYLRQPRTIEPGPVDRYAGDPLDTFWAFDEEMARATQNYHADQVGKQPQLIGFVQDGKLVEARHTHPMVELKFWPEPDGETFHLSAKFLDTVTSMPDGKNGPGQNNLVRWSGLAAGASIGHATGGGAIQFHRIEGPIEKIGPDTFRLCMYRGYTERQDIWVCATHPGDEEYKSAVQQATMKLPRSTIGADQTITFDEIPDQNLGTTSVNLSARSSAGLPVHFFVREGPADVDGRTIRFLAPPVRAKFPIKVTVVAWQWGRTIEPRVKTAAIVERTFAIEKR